MHLTKNIPYVLLLLTTFASCSQQEAAKVYTKEPLWYAHSALQEIPFYEVHIQDDFWSERIQTVADSTLPLVWELAREQGRMENFKIVAGQSDATYHMRNSPDAPVYKLIEAAAYTFTQTENKTLEAAIDSLIALAGQAQQEDGYLHTQFMLPKGDPSTPTDQAKAMETFGFGQAYQWKSKYTSWPKGYSQLFTAGHMFEAAVAYYRATGKHALLDISIKFAALLTEVFQDEAFVKQYADHPEVEIGLMKLYEVSIILLYLLNR